MSMIARNIQHYENRISKLSKKSEIINAALIRKAKRNLNKAKKTES